MPSESEVHVARSFLTKILRSSMRKNRFKRENDLKMRPQSWYYSKQTEESEEPTGAGPPTRVWQYNHDSRTKRPVIQGHQDSQSLTDKIEKEDQVKQHGCLYPAEHSRNIDRSRTAESKKDSGFSCLPGRTSTKGTSTENIFFKGLPNEAAPPPDQQSSRGNRVWEKGMKDGLLTSKVSLGYTPVVGPVQQTPGKDNQTSTSPPVSLCTDSYAGTKVFPYCKGIGGSRGIHARSVDKLTETNKHPSFSEYQERRLEAGRSFNPLPSGDFLRPDMAVKQHKHLSLSSSDVSVEGFYHSLQDLPSNAPIQRQARHSTAATGSDVNPTLGDAQRSMHFGMAEKHLTLKFRHVEVESRKINKDKSHNTTRVHNKGYSHAGSSLHNEHRGLEQPTKSLSPVGAVDSDFVALRKVLSHQTFSQSINFSTLNDPWVPRENHKRSLQKMQQHYLTAQENRSLLENHSSPRPQEQVNETVLCSRGSVTPHQVRQKKLAQLQRSRSAAILTGHVEEEDEEEEWSSTLTYNSFSSTYKDNLKEAQARVLQATSFQRRDLEPVGPFQVSGYKRPLSARRVHSFSEPDKIHQVGVEGNPYIVCFRERRKYLEGRRQFCRPVLKTSKNTGSDLMGKYKGNCPIGTLDRSSLGLRCEQMSSEQKRLGTFSEYRATWSQQQKSFEAKTQGQFHSTENILDADVEVTSSSFADLNSQSISSMCTGTLSNRTLREHSEPQPDHSSHHRPILEPSHRDVAKASKVVPTLELLPGLEFSASMDGPPVLYEKEDTPPSPQVQLVPQDPGPWLTRSVTDQTFEDNAHREGDVGVVAGEGQSLADVPDKCGRKTTMDQLDEEGPAHCWASGGPRLLTVPRGEEDGSLATPVSSLVPSSSYYNTSAPKAELLIKMKDMQVEEQEEQDIDLADKKLCGSLPV
ncbi:protein Shroom2-like isoform X2 [Synchiropus splendidus]|uniref:protein Shroom2-like isoform X2 n=1 Tax=Synchiropus splendidus TaxID=270530 RepID=UPI00237E604D|nr:protein Shroom2-like isoform X2 [Synchiropus splendidus]